MSVNIRAGCVRHARRISCAALLLFATTAACGGSDKGTGPGPGPSGDFNGTYSLRQIGGQNVPFQLDDGQGNSATITGGSLVIAGGNQWTLTVRATMNGQSGPLLEDEGTLTRSGNTVDFESSSFGDRFGGSLSGGTLTLQYDADGDGTGDLQLTFAK